MVRRRFSTFISITIFLAVLDAWLTDYLQRNIVGGEELNPLVYTNNFFTILFSPIPVLIMILYVLCLMYAERNHEKLQDLINERSMKVGLFVFTLYFPISRLLTVINNLFPVFERTTPVVWISAPFERWTDSPFMQLVFAETLIVMLTFPILLYWTKRIYRVNSDIPQS